VAGAGAAPSRYVRAAVEPASSGVLPREAPADAWFVVHTHARCEKKVEEFCARAGAVATLPLYRSVRRYRGKTVVFEKPLFPGYVFLEMPAGLRAAIQQHERVARVLEVPAQEEFADQLAAILRALESGYEVRLQPTIGPGSRVRIKTGPLRGLEGLVESRRGLVEVHLRLEFIGQGAAVRIDADFLEGA